MVLGFRVWGFRGLGLRVWGLGFCKVFAVVESLYRGFASQEA